MLTLAQQYFQLTDIHELANIKASNRVMHQNCVGYMHMFTC